MHIIDRLQLQHFVRLNKSQGKTTGLILIQDTVTPALTPLIGFAKNICDSLIVCVFAPPHRRKNPGAGASTAPLTTLTTLLEKEPIDGLFLPLFNEISPPKSSFSLCFQKPHNPQAFDFSQLEDLERKQALIFCRILNIIAPDIYITAMINVESFLLKKHIIEEFRYPVKLITAPISRDSSQVTYNASLALLTHEDRKNCPLILRSLEQAKLWYRSGVTDLADLTTKIQEGLDNYPRFSLIRIYALEKETLHVLSDQLTAGFHLVICVLVNSIEIWDCILIENT